MKKFFMVVLALFISVAFVSAVFAQAKPEAAPAKAAPEKAAPAKAEKAAPAPEKAAAPAPEKAVPEKAAAPEKPKPKPKPKGVFIGGVSAVDAAAKTVTVVSKCGTKGEQGSVTFVLNNVAFKGYKSLEEIQVGDVIAVKYVKDGIEIKKIKGKKPEKAKKEAVKKVKKGFKDIDSNKDGKITIEELVIVFVTVTPEQFKQFDKNNDGALDEKEYKDAIKALK